jgi:hypothetical protein
MAVVFGDGNPSFSTYVIENEFNTDKGVDLA